MAVEQIVVPDFGDVQDITVVEVYIKPGDSVEEESPLIALESEKAVMDVPSPLAGVITEVRIKENEMVKSGDLIALIEVSGEQRAEAEPEGESVEEAAESRRGEEPGRAEPEHAQAQEPPAEPVADKGEDRGEQRTYHATPSVRAYARELEIDLAQVTGTGPKGRIVKEDVQALVKSALKGGSPPAANRAGAIAEQPLEDFSAYGEIEEVELSRIKKISGPHLQRSWQLIPHVCHFDEADVTELEEFRTRINAEEGKEGLKFSALVFVIKAVVAALKAFPLFNCSLHAHRRQGGGETLLPYRHRRGYPGWAGGAGDQERRPQGHARDCRRTSKIERCRPGGKVGDYRYAGRLLHYFKPWRDRWHRVHPYHQQPADGYPRVVPQHHETGLGRGKIRSPADPAVFPHL